MESPKARIVSIESDSPAYRANLSCGGYITDVGGSPLRDIIDWMWFSSDDVIDVGYESPDGVRSRVLMSREMDEGWGISFDGIIFDGVRICRNACKFCFMQQLPMGMRDSLTLRDDDFRLSFLSGTFVTLTNLTDDDISRIIEQHISPLRVSLHAITPEVRRDLIGKHEKSGREALRRLLDAGISFDAQIVLCPGINDGEELERTLSWAYDEDGIDNIGIVPLGFTSHQTRFDSSFDDPAASKAVLDQVSIFQERALKEKGYPWVFAADEFYRNAFPDNLDEHLPSAEMYRDYPMFEDGIGIIRSSIDELKEAFDDEHTEALLRKLEGKGIFVHLIAGRAMDPYAAQILRNSPLSKRFDIMYVDNTFFGGNVNVTGLLTGEDIISAISAHVKQYHAFQSPKAASSHIYLIPDVIFNSDMLTLDGMRCDDVVTECGQDALIVPSNPLDCIHQLESSI